MIFKIIQEDFNKILSEYFISNKLHSIWDMYKFFKINYLDYI